MVLSQPYYTERRTSTSGTTHRYHAQFICRTKNLWERCEGAKPYAAPGKPAIVKQRVSWTQSYSKDVHTSANKDNKQC